MKKRKRRGLRSFMAVALCFSLIVTQGLPAAYASQPEAERQTLCEHHPAHDESCGYTEETKGTTCTHEHTEECYAIVTECVHEHTEDCYPAEDELENRAATPSEPNETEPSECTHECSEESGCITREPDCRHEHDRECGYTQDVEGTACTYLCKICNAPDGMDATASSCAKAEKCTCEALCTEDNINEACPVCGEENADLTACKGKILDGAQEKICICISSCAWNGINVDCPLCGAKDADLSACREGLEEEEPPAGTRVWVSTADGGTNTNYKNIPCRYENKWGERLLVFEGPPIYYQSPEDVTFFAGTPFSGTTGSNNGASTSISLKDQSDLTSIDCWTAKARGDKSGSPNLWFEFFSELAKVKLVIDAGEDGGEVSVTAKNVASGYQCGSKHEDQIEAFSEKTDIALAMTDLGDGRWMAEGLLVPGSAPEISITWNEKTETVSLADSFQNKFSEGWIYFATLSLSATSGNWSVRNVQDNTRGTWEAYLYTGDFWIRNGGELAPATICGAPVFMDERSSWGFTPETALTGKVTVPAHTETVQMKDLFFASPDGSEMMTYQDGNTFIHMVDNLEYPTEVYFQTDGSSDWSTEPIELLPGETKTVLIRTYGKYYSIEITRETLETAVTINYEAETITFDDTVFEVNPNKQFTDSPIAGSGSITDYIGYSIYIRVKAKADAPASGITEIFIPARPAAPGGLHGVNETDKGAHNGKITGVSVGMQYRKESDTLWTDCTGDTVENLGPGTYEVRTKATENSFASIAKEVTIGVGNVITIKLPTFDPVRTGYTQPDPKPIEICNSSDEDATIVSVSCTGVVFKIQPEPTQDLLKIPAHGKNTHYALQPEPGMVAGEYTTPITVTYRDTHNNTHAVTATARFTVLPQPVNGGGDDSPSSGDSGGSGMRLLSEGTWVRDSVGWWYRKTDGTYPVSCWQKLAYGKTVEWYHFDERGYMQTSWFTDADGRTYYLHDVSDGRQGYMYTGWHQIDGKWYYFREVQDGTEGALYKNTRTPDGYRVDENGVWKP